MNTLVTARGFDVSAPDREYVERKVEKLARYFGGIQKLELILSLEGLLVRAEAVMTIVKGENIVCHVDQAQLRAAVDLVVDKAENALTRHKDRLRDHRIVPTEPPTRGRKPEERLDSYQDVVDQTEFPK